MVTKHELDQRARQKNPNHIDFWKCRGWRDRPPDWKERVGNKTLLPSRSKPP
jgi:hypothetical protein